MAVKKKAHAFRRILLLLALGLAIFGAFSYWSLPDPAPLKSQNPAMTALMQARMRQAQENGHKLTVRQKWVDYAAISKIAIDAVIVSEDASFFAHNGIDYQELENAISESLRQRRLARGASTITQQLAKNLWLSNERSVLRKLKEWILAKRLEERLSKKRILTLYLNLAEWGDGIFGIDAAARAYFQVSPRELSTAQSAMLAAMLPSPRKWTPTRRPSVLLKRSRRVVERLARANRISLAEASATNEELEKFFHVPSELNPELEPEPDENDEVEN